jgi:hypothetical protein
MDAETIKGVSAENLSHNIPAMKLEKNILIPPSP